MTNGILAQAQALLIALPIGFALGLLYDLIRPARRRATPRREFLLDLLYWLTVCAAIFLCAPILAEGYVRISLLLVHALGAWLYFKLFSRPLRALAGHLERGCCAVFAFLTRPFRWLSAVLTARWAKFFRHLQKSTKKIFSFPLQWVKMKTMLKRSKPDTESSLPQQEGMPHDKNQKGWFCD